MRKEEEQSFWSGTLKIYCCIRILLFAPTIITTCTILLLLLHRNSHNIPVLPVGKVKAPILLCIIKMFASNEYNHRKRWYRSIKIKWPVIDAMRCNALLTLNRPNDIIFWLKRVSFHKCHDKRMKKKKKKKEES